jgi:pilus assembly protein CpaC
MNKQSKRLLACLGLVAGLLQAGAPALGQTTAPGASKAAPVGDPGVIRVGLSTPAAAVESVSIARGKSVIVELPVDVRDILVTDPKVADAVLRSARRISVLGVGTGQTDAVFFDAGGHRIAALNIRVDQDVSAMAQTINRILPGARVQVDAVNNSVVLSGLVANLADADKAVQIAQQFTTKPEQVLNMLSIAGKEQVMLKVRIVEIQRSVIKQLGFNLAALTNQLGGPQFLLNAAATYGVNGALLGGLSTGLGLDTTQQPELQQPCTGAGWQPGALCPVVVRGGSHNTSVSNGSAATIQPTAGSAGLNKGGATVQAFESVGLVRILAEPNLTAVSGESAKFLAGGEFPVPAGEDNTGRTVIVFKPFGVGLGFTPIVLSGGRISLKISTEVSELSSQGALTLAGGSGSGNLTIPSLTVRRAETSVELPSGGAMMIAGLLQEETKQDIDSVPGLASMPVLGALFRSRDYLEGETELVVIVTPYLVNSTNPANLQTPADGLRMADDAETDLLGRMNKTYHAPTTAEATTSPHGYQGPVGYIIE